MNLSELARKVRVPANQLKEILPQMGFDIGQRAIKVDDRVAQQIIKQWPFMYKKWQAQKRLAEETAITKKAAVISEKKPIQIPPAVTVRDLAAKLGLPVTRVIQELMKSGIFASLNERIDYETASIIADDMGFKVEPEVGGLETKPAQEEKLKAAFDKEEKVNLKARAPVVVVMGHVDHGKTKLLDAIRRTNVVAGEAGGITQHIGAYQVERRGRPITFIDTPGHEAFTAMRSRGARVADVAILVVAADDGVMPQTVEAIRIIEAAKLPMVVAINKIDKPEANIDRVKQDLSRYNLVPEDYGGKTIVVPVSAMKGTGIDDLLETILLVADLDKDKIMANPDRLALGTVVESHVDKNMGPVATVLVQAGTLHNNDILSIEGTFYGKVKAMKDWNAQNLKDAVPSTPVQVLGFKVAPKVGDIVEVTADMTTLAKKGNKRDLARETTSSMTTVKKKKEKTEKPKKILNLIIRADVLGSLEAVIESLEKFDDPEVGTEIIGKGLGSITETDVLRAESTHALILGFNVKPNQSAEKLVREKKGVEIKLYKIIYDLLAEVRTRLENMLDAEIIRTDLGEAKVLAIFRKESGVQVIGAKVAKGKLVPGASISAMRDGIEVTKGTLEELQHNKQISKEVYEGQECGIKFRGKTHIEVGDTLVVYREEKRVRKFASE